MNPNNLQLAVGDISPTGKKIVSVSEVNGPRGVVTECTICGNIEDRGRNQFLRPCKACRTGREALRPNVVDESINSRLAKRKAERKAQEFTLTDEEVNTITNGKCEFCGAAPASRVFSERFTGIEVLKNEMSLIRPRLGYVTGNVVAACSRCNTVKGDMSWRQFKVLVKTWDTNLKTRNVQQD